MKAVLAAGRGMRFTETTTLSGGAGERAERRRKDNHRLHLWHTELLGHDEQLVNPAEPATLAALLKNGRLSGETVTGAITFK
ncbi:hypothetical protein AB0C33_35080 [Nonomuraea sp. NPDC048881]|uniref:hypothetical protein n=1 Tax=Nonomuraea sp. NPDC048881 TaxID=3155030 RepID=UPI0033E010E3